MTPSDVLRAQEARRRLRDVAGDGQASDTAIRVIELESPRTDGVPLQMHPDFAVVSGLSAGAHDQVLATIDALHQNTRSVGLGGAVVTSGEIYELHDPTIPALQNTEDLIDLHLHTSPDGESFLPSGRDLVAVVELISAVEDAVMLTSAELRGADAIATDLRGATLDVPEVIDLRTTDADRREIRQTLEALDALEPDEQAIAELAERLQRISETQSAGTLQATIEQYSAALEQVQPSDAGHVRHNLERALDDAVEALNAQQRARRTDAFGVVDVLARLGVVAGPENAIEVGERIITERSELTAIRARLIERLETPTIRPQVLTESPELIEVERRTSALRRKLRTQRHILASARLMRASIEGETATASTINDAIGPLGDHGRSLPIVLVDPLVDLPTASASVVLSSLLNVSRQHQVICLSDRRLVLEWAQHLQGRVGWTHANGWFAGQPE